METLLIVADEEDKLKGFDLGIVDYVTKPFSPRELMARTKVNLLKQNNIQNAEKYVFDGVVIDRTMQEVKNAVVDRNFTLTKYDIEYNIYGENIEK